MATNFIKTDRSGLGLWRPYKERSQRFSQSINKTIILPTTKRQQAAQQAIDEKPVTLAQLPVDFAMRDLQLQVWAEQKPLTAAQIDSLKQRGLSDANISDARSKGLLWAIDFGDNPLHSDLPGIWDTARNGKARTGFYGGRGMGIACQQLTADGELLKLGAQIAPSKADISRKAAQGGTLAKYMWLSNSDNPQRAAKVPQLGGNPITVFPTGKAAAHAVISEGTLKPLVSFLSSS